MHKTFICFWGKKIEYVPEISNFIKEVVSLIYSCNVKNSDGVLQIYIAA